jgi:hypothetical protein
MKYFALTLTLILAACGTTGTSAFMSGFCLENPSAGIPAQCRSVQQIDAGDF